MLDCDVISLNSNCAVAFNLTYTLGKGMNPPSPLVEVLFNLYCSLTRRKMALALNNMRMLISH